MAVDGKSTNTVVGVVLAAGRSSRLAGEVPKQLLDFAGESLVRRAVRTALAARLAAVVVVVGYRSNLVKHAYAGLEGAAGAAQTVYNSDFAAGQSTSLRCALAAVREQATGAIFLPVDQPFLSAGLIDRLVAAHREGAAIAMPVAAGRRGAPVLFARRFFPELKKLTGDIGGRSLLQSHAKEIQRIEANDPRELMDLDTADDLRRLSALVAPP